LRAGLEAPSGGEATSVAQGESTAPASRIGIVSTAYAEEAPPRAERRVSFPTAGFGVKGLTSGQYMLTELNVLVYYIALLAVPVNQNLDYDFPVSSGLFEVLRPAPGTVLNYSIPPPVVSLAILLLIVGAGVYLLLRARRRGAGRGLVVSFFIFWFFVILVPTSSFIPVVDVIFEHRLYLASLGFFVILVLLVDWLASRIPALVGVKGGRR